MAIEDLDLTLGAPLDLLQAGTGTMILKLIVALIADTMLLSVSPRYLLPVLAACIAYSPSTALAVASWVVLLQNVQLLNLFRELSPAELAVFSLFDSIIFYSTKIDFHGQVSQLRVVSLAVITNQGILYIDGLVLDAVNKVTH